MSEHAQNTLVAAVFVPILIAAAMFAASRNRMGGAILLAIIALDSLLLTVLGVLQVYGVVRQPL